MAQELRTRDNLDQVIAQHTVLKSEARERFWSTSCSGLTQGAYRLLDLAHDVGKAVAIRLARDKDQQHVYSAQFLDAVADQLPLEPGALARIKAMIVHDPLGPYLRTDAKQVELDRTLERLREAAKQAGLGLSDYLEVLTPYYQSDVAAYATVSKRLASVFGDELVFDPGLRRLRFNPEVETRWSDLEQAVQLLEAQESAPAPSSIRVPGPGLDYARAQPDGTAFPESVDGLSVIKQLGGHSGAAAQLVRDAAGNQFVLKTDNAQNPGHLREEHRTNRLERAMGLTVPAQKIYETPAGDVLLSEYVPGGQPFLTVFQAPETRAQAQRGAQAAFARIALVADWDAFAMNDGSGTNVLAFPQQEGAAELPLLWVDTGGGLRRRSKGELKSTTANPFDAYPTELWTLRDPPGNGFHNRSREIVGSTPWTEIVRQIDDLLPLARELRTTAAVDPEVQSILLARLENLRFVSDATGALGRAGVSPERADALLGQVMEEMKNGAPRPSIRQLIEREVGKASKVSHPSRVEPELLASELLRNRGRVEELPVLAELAARHGLEVFLEGETAGDFVHQLRWRLLSEAGAAGIRPAVVESNDLANITELENEPLRLAVRPRDPIIPPQESLEGFTQAVRRRLPGIQVQVREIGTGYFSAPAGPVSSLDELFVPLQGEHLDSAAAQPLRDAAAGLLSLASRGEEPGLREVMRLVTQASRYGLALDAPTRERMARVVAQLDPAQVSAEDRAWLAENAPKLALRSASLEQAWSMLDELGLREKLLQLEHPDLTLFLSRKVLPSSSEGVPTGRTARDLDLDIVTHTAPTMGALKAITGTPYDRPNLFISMWAKGQRARYGEGAYTVAGSRPYHLEKRRDQVFAFSARVEPDAREGVDFEYVEHPVANNDTPLDYRYVIFKNSSKVHLLDEAQGAKKSDPVEALLDAASLAKPHLRRKYVAELERAPLSQPQRELYLERARELIQRMDELGPEDVLAILSGPGEVQEASVFRSLFYEHPELSEALIREMARHQAQGFPCFNDPVESCRVTRKTFEQLLSLWMPRAEAVPLARTGLELLGQEVHFPFLETVVPLDQPGMLDPLLFELYSQLDTTYQWYALRAISQMEEPARMRRHLIDFLDNPNTDLEARRFDLMCLVNRENQRGLSGEGLEAARAISALIRDRLARWDAKRKCAA